MRVSLAALISLKLLSSVRSSLKEALRELVTYRQASGYGLAITEVRQEGPRDEAKAVVAGITARLKKVGTRPANVDFANMDWSWLNVR